MLKSPILLLIALLFFSVIHGQNDSLQKRGIRYHFQLTVVRQGHPGFSAKYSGLNSLDNTVEHALSLTTTLFLGGKLWKGGTVYFNPEIAGGSGISQAKGIAGFPNGETFRIGDPSPALYVARLYYQQIFALKNAKSIIQEDGPNQIGGKIPDSRIVLTAGKFGNADVFDNNRYSHDPRTQFLNWSLMSNAAWDYPANTRGYTDIIAGEFIKPTWAFRLSTALVPKFANGPTLDYHYFQAHSETIEIEKSYQVKKRTGTFRLLAFYSRSKAPSYDKTVSDYLSRADTSLDVIYGKNYGGIKYGFGINAQQAITDDLGIFLRTSWNNGKTATWAFTEIDRTASFGLSLTGSKWRRKDDVAGLAVVSNGISPQHRNFLNTGGYGFIIGDGKLSNYGREFIIETFYSHHFLQYFMVSLDYQFVNNPGYNRDRGPVHIFSLRFHVEI